MKVPETFMNCFAIPEIVLHNFYTMNRRYVEEKKKLFFSVALENSRNGRLTRLTVWLLILYFILTFLTAPLSSGFVFG